MMWYKLQVSPGLQEGIYYSHNDNPRNSLALVSLRVKQNYEASKIRETISRLWQRYSDLRRKNSITLRGLRGNDQNLGNLSVLLGYGPRFFEISGIEKEKPDLLKDEWLFEIPTYPKAPILPEIGLKYDEEVTQNLVADDHIIIQFIGNTQAATHRAIVETWKILQGSNETESNSPLFMRTFYTGFNNSDGRGWLGFHDGISNIKNSERLKTIQIVKRTLRPKDYWTASGTYMTFIKIKIDLTLWESISEKEQERIIGRQKSTGCPILYSDEKGNNFFLKGCPVPGTKQTTEKGNERFREYLAQNVRSTAIPGANSDYKMGHVQLMRGAPDRVFRQGYEFLEQSENYPFFQVGLHFISFQSGTDKIYRTIKYGFGKVNFGGQMGAGTDRLLSVQSAGIFLVPPITKAKEFPGEVIFQKS